MKEQSAKRRRGRPPLDKMTRTYTLDRQLALFLDSLPDGERSKFANVLLLQGVAIEKIIGRYYVYLLMRPDGSPFYIGKGQGNRIDQHETEARKGIQSHKCNVIRQIWETGGEVIKQKVAFFEQEEDAYQLEMLLISFFGMEHLTNCTAGGEGTSYGLNHRKRIPVVLSIADARLTWAINMLKAQGIEDPTDQQVSRFVKDWCYERIDEDIQKERAKR